MSILQEIKKYKLDFVKNQKNKISQSEIIDNCNDISSEEKNIFSKKLIVESNSQISIIGELKKWTIIHLIRKKKDFYTVLKEIHNTIQKILGENSLKKRDYD